MSTSGKRGQWNLGVSEVVFVLNMSSPLLQIVITPPGVRIPTFECVHFNMSHGNFLMVMVGGRV